ncbi:MAG: hypothetical protein EXR62_07215 [Chloroflexi bacterium]|nr:hypothetical protein [Chloroflexota bacterium]
MDSAMINKIEKAKLYAQEPNRVIFSQFNVTVEGDHRNHNVTYNEGQWSCDCDFFSTRGLCTHTMTMERILGSMIKPEWSPAV